MCLLVPHVLVHVEERGDGVRVALDRHQLHVEANVQQLQLMNRQSIK